MPPKERLTKEMIICGAYELLRKEGYERVNARTLASELGCSTMPLFRQFDTMDEIRAEAVLRGITLYNEYIARGMTDEIPFKGVGGAYIRFAREEPKLFQLFFMTPKELVKFLPENDPNYDAVNQCAANAVGGDLTGGERIYREMWIFVHGIATMIVNGTNTWSDEEISAMSSEVFSALKQQEQEKGEKR